MSMDKAAIDRLIEVGLTNKFEDYSVDGEHVPMQIVPNSYQVVIPNLQQAEAWLDRPLRKRGNFNFGTADSFSRYVNEHKDENTRLFGQISEAGANIRAILNFHGKEPAWADHGAAFALRQTPEWKTFSAANGADMSQSEFATWIEEHSELLVTPTGAALLELVTNLEGSTHCQIDSAMKMKTGAIRLRVSEEVTLKSAGGSQSTTTKESDLELPSILEFGVAPFEGTAAYRIQARLKYSITSRKLHLWFQAINLHLVVRKVVTDVFQNITKQTGIEPFIA